MADPNQKSVFLAYAALSIGVVCIGVSGIFVKFAGAPGAVSVFYRVLISGILTFDTWEPSLTGATAALQGHRDSI